jgi:hypothetical protein
LREIALAFDLVNFEKRQQKRLGLALREQRSKLQIKPIGMPVLSSELILIMISFRQVIYTTPTTLAALQKNSAQPYFFQAGSGRRYL